MRTGRERPNSPRPMLAKAAAKVLDTGGVEVLASGIHLRPPSINVGPAEAIRRVRFGDMGVAGRNEWFESARLGAVLGGCQRSTKSLCSGLRCYVAFVGTSLQQGMTSGVLACYRRLGLSGDCEVFPTDARDSPCLVDSFSGCRHLFALPRA